ncbi:MAG: MFS transporter, partial [Nakamurella sp.]
MAKADDGEDDGLNPALDPKRWLALGVIAISQLMVILDATIVNIALPQAQAALQISDANRQWMVTAYALPFGALLLLGGRIADYVGRKRILIIALSGFALASAVGGFAQAGWELFIARAFQGAFAAMLAPAALSLVTVTFSAAKERAKAFAVFGAIAGGGAAVGLLLGGILTEYASWRWCLFVNIPIAIIAVLLAVPVLRESKVHGSTHYDIPGAVLATAGLGSLVWACTQPAEHGWGSPNTLVWLAVAVVLLVGFVLVELRSSAPLLPMRIVENRNRAGAYVVGLLVGAGLFAIFL